MLTRSRRLPPSRFIRSSVRRLPILFAIAAAACSCATSAHAHGFGQRYDLPLPLSLYLFGTAAAVVFSFVVAGLFVRRPFPPHRYPRVNLLVFSAGRWLAGPAAGLFFKLLGLGLFVLTIAAGFFGNQNPFRNISPTLVWVIWWVGLTFVSAFVGDIWPLLNPWRTVFEWAERIATFAARREHPPRPLRYPAELGVWPAVALLLAFSWTELVFPSPAVPRNIAWLAVGYSILTGTGMLAFGRETWLRHGEIFTVFFGLFARFAPTEVRVRDSHICERCALDCRNTVGECIGCCDCFRRADPHAREWALRPFAAGLLGGEATSNSMVAFVLLVLSTVLYDGFLATPEWTQLERPLSGFLPVPVWLDPLAIRTLGLIGFWALFLGAYVAICALMSAAARESLSARDMAQNFASTLVPIAIGYSVAHYLTFLLIQGQYIIPLASDPFGFGWDLFATAGYRVDIAVVGARFAWYAAVTAILLGHIAAVYLAHAKAINLLAQRSAALRSELPLTALMVVYTFVSLSILAEPIVERRAPAQPTMSAAVAIPEDAVLPEPGSGRLAPVGTEKFAQVKLTYRLLGSAFHDGTRTTPADLLYPYIFTFRWSAQRETDDAHYDPAIDAATAVMRKHLAGMRFAGTDTKSKSFRVGDFDYVRELFIVEVFMDLPPGDPEQDAAVAPPWSTLPWHLIVLMEEAVSRSWAAFSQAEARRRGIEWLDLARSETMNARLMALVETFERDGYRPETLRSLVSVEEARKRWTALAAFFREHGHFLVTNGPYQLKRWSADSVTLDVFRDLSYPLGVGSFDAYAIPRRGYITKVERENDGLRLFADIETVMKFQRSYRLVREPLPAVAAEVRRRAAPECRYRVIDDNGRVAAAGAVAPSEDWTFRVDLRGRLPAGRYTVLAQVTVNGNAMNAEIERIPIVISPGS
jgi:hypothetical protein